MINNQEFQWAKKQNLHGSDNFKKNVSNILPSQISTSITSDFGYEWIIDALVSVLWPTNRLIYLQITLDSLMAQSDWGKHWGNFWNERVSFVQRIGEFFQTLIIFHSVVTVDQLFVVGGQFVIATRLGVIMTIIVVIAHLIVSRFVFQIGRWRRIL